MHHDYRTISLICHSSVFRLIWAQLPDIQQLTEDAFKPITAEQWRSVCEHLKRMEAGYWAKENLSESEIDWWAKGVKGISQSRILTYDFLSLFTSLP